MSNFTNALGLDVGGARIGVARINSIAQISEPLKVLKNDDQFDKELVSLITEYSADLIVVGKPRNMSGETTQQTEIVEQFAEDHLKKFGVTYVFQDETLSTVAAEGRMPKNATHLQDAYAACVILEDYLATQNNTVQ
jgi:putative Holliday junction resolvase